MLTFGDALALLGEDPPATAALDRAIGGALNLATGGLGGEVLAVLEARRSVLGLGRTALSGLATRLRGSDGRVERARVLTAAHTVIVVVAFFDALEQAPLPFSFDEVELTRREQLALAGARPASREERDTSAREGRGAREDLAETLQAVDAPHPAPHLPYEECRDRLRGWYGRLAHRVHDFLRGLAQWDRIDDRSRRAAGEAFRTSVPEDAVRRYEELYARLAEEAPEFRFWSGQMEHRATRAEMRRALAGLETSLAAKMDYRPPVDLAQALARSHRSALARRILDTEATPEGIRVPTLGETYLDPGFRVREVDGTSTPAEEDWWAQAAVRHDLTEYLTGALTSEGLLSAPLLVLGQPGAGKSVLTRILAARLPAGGFLPVRVALRDMRAEDGIQDQIEQAVRDATGERAHWPEVVRAAGSAVPVVLFDGFDELLQTTGVHQNNYLLRIARFQEREREQGRPVLAVVTSRTAVADRARYPEGTVALRLEPFRPEQIEAWIGQWNRVNADTFRAMRRPPLGWDLVAPHRALAEQPLLLTMLALYQAAGNDLSGTDARPLAEADLYEALLGSFARREVRKDGRGESVPDAEVEHSVEQELQRLSLVAFAMLNRRRQWVTTAELEEDLVALLGRPADRPVDLRGPLGPAEVALGRFFFVQRAQSIRDGQKLSTYEFLHATFGEYLAVRLTVQLLKRLLAHQPALSMGNEPLDDDLLFTLLSFAPLSSRQMLRFARPPIERLPQSDRARLARLVVRALRERELCAGEPHPAYMPRRIRTASRHGIYSANLVLLALLLTGGTSASVLFPTSSDPASAWHRQVLLWRSSFSEEEWTDFALLLELHRTKDDERREVGIAFRDGELSPPEPVDAHWLFRVPREDTDTFWLRTYWDEIWHKIDASAGTNDGVALQALRPLLETLGPLLSMFNGGGSGPATSIAHDFLRLWVGDGEMPAQEAAALYRRTCVAFPYLDDGHSRRLSSLLLTLLERDLPRYDTEEARHILGALSDVAPDGLKGRIAGRLTNRHPDLLRRLNGE